MVHYYVHQTYRTKDFDRGNSVVVHAKHFAYFAPADLNIQKAESDPRPSANHVSRETMNG
jgi:hypothetical protein